MIVLSLYLPVWSGGFENAVVRVSRTVSTRRDFVAMVMSDEVTRDFDYGLSSGCIFWCDGGFYRGHAFFIVWVKVACLSVRVWDLW